MDPFRRQERCKPVSGVLDTNGGMAIADKACRFALHYARLLGAKFVFGPESGFFESFRYEGNRVTGIKTRDGKTHRASLTLVACGGWTPVLVPQLDGLCEATAGSIALLKIPRSLPLWDRLGPESFPTFMWNMRNGAEGGLYGFPRNEEGWFKIGYRGTKYTNPIAHGDGNQRSTPVTRWSTAHKDGQDSVGDRLTSCPQQALKVIRSWT
jgi:sarcosine oxidase / L-pipecolate oxidase